MDSIDVKILGCLKENARQNASAIGEYVNMSVSAVIERIKKLENSGVIQQYTLLLDTKKIGKDISAFIENVKQNPQVTECHYITGDFDFLLKVITGSTQELEAVLNEIKCIHGVSLTKTLVVLSTMKNEHSVLPDLSK